MGLDFNPELYDEVIRADNQRKEKKKVEEAKRASELSSAMSGSSVSATSETAIVMSGGSSSDVVTMNNLLNITQSHIHDDNECRAIIGRVTEELNNSIHLMSIKDLIDFYKAKVREREFHVDCIFKAYAFIQKSEFAREMLVGSSRKERIIEVSDRKRITGLLNMLNKTD